MIDITGTTDIRDGQWHFLTFIRTGLRTGEIWVDGKLESEDTDNSGTLSGINTPYTTMRFGYSSDGSFMEGNLAHFKIFNYRLTEDQINLLYNDFSAGLIKPNTTRYFLPLSQLSPTINPFSKIITSSTILNTSGKTVIRRGA